MARNKLAGKGKVYSQRSEASRKKKLAYDKKFQKRPEQVKKRVEANRANRKAGTYGNGDKKDASHQKDGSIKMEAQSKNRGRKGEGNRVKKNKKKS